MEYFGHGSFDYGYHVALVHSFYSEQQPSGENEAVLAEYDLLRRYGHRVGLMARRTDALSSRPGYRLKAALTTATGRGSSPLGDIAELEADVVHVHNLFPNFGRTWLRRLDKPLVVTLHNYRPLCAKATLFRDGRVCTDCVDGSRLAGLIHRCYRGKARATLPLTVGQRGAQRDLLDRADRLIVLSDVERDFYRRAGVPMDKMRVVPNFLPADRDGGAGPGGEAWLYAGRISEDKGALRLLEAWPAEIPLVVAGTADDERAVTDLARGKRIDFRGKLPRDEVFALLRTSRGLAFPSRWPETFGLVYIEALAAGTPVLAAPPAAAASFIKQDGTGMTAPTITTDKIRVAHERFVDLRAAARRAFDLRYTGDRHIEALADVYAEAIAARVRVTERSGSSPAPRWS